MALNTYAALKTAIAIWLNRSDLSDEIADDFIKLTEADFNSKLRIRQMEQIDTITIDSETETVPTGFIGVRSFYILSSDTKYTLEYITPHNLFEIRDQFDKKLFEVRQDRGTQIDFSKNFNTVISQ